MSTPIEDGRSQREPQRQLNDRLRVAREDTREIRLQRLARLETAGINPFPAERPFISHTNSEVVSDFEELEGREVNVAGRIMSIRNHGKTIFMDLEDGSGKLQINISKDPEKEEDPGFELVSDNYDTGDFVHAAGPVFRTRRGEVTVKVEKIDMLAKAILPPPNDRSGRIDPERARRQRYLELMASPEARERFRTRSRMVQMMREVFMHYGFLEVETPVLDTVYGGADASPFTTVMKALDYEPMFLRIANELYLKRLVVGNMGPVFEFSRNFRNEGMDRTHNPEFTAVEAYKPYADYEEMMTLAETMFEGIALQIHGSTKVKFGDQEIDFKAPWRRVTIYDGLRQAYGLDPNNITDEELLSLAQQHGLPEKRLKRRGDMLLGLFEAYFDGKLIQPTFVLDFPRETSALAKRHRENNDLAERFECSIAGLEVMNCYTELNDPRDQRNQFEEQERRRMEGDQEAMQIDEDFLLAMEHGMPPMGGIGISIDRMAMILTDTIHIRDIILFPQSKKAKTP